MKHLSQDLQPGTGNCTLTLGVGAISADQAEKPAPAAVALEIVKDFGVVNKGQRVTHEFQIRNDGDAVLQITEVRPSCGCTVADFDRTVAPGATGKVKATVDTRNFKGGIAKSVRVFTNDPCQSPDRPRDQGQCEITGGGGSRATLALSRSMASPRRPVSSLSGLLIGET